MERCSSTSSSDYGEDLENVCAILAADTVTVRRKVWVHDINMKRKEKGEFHNLVKELEEHPNRYEKYFRTTKEEFNVLHDLIRATKKTRNTQFREAISPMPYVIAGDEAFPLKKYLLRPYSKQHQGGEVSNKIYNYRLSRARRVVENASGILASRWTVFRRPFEVQPETVASITCSVKNVTRQMKLSYCVPECLAYEIYNLGKMRPVKQQVFEIASEIILIRLLVQYHGN
jgi:hypothetical protein